MAGVLLGDCLFFCLRLEFDGVLSGGVFVHISGIDYTYIPDQPSDTILGSRGAETNMVRKRRDPLGEAGGGRRTDGRGLCSLYGRVSYGEVSR